MKRVLCLLSGMNMGGAETFLMKTYRTLDKDKYQMDFCVNVAEEGVYDKEILSMGGKIYHIPAKSANPKAFKNGLREIVQKQNYEYVLRVTSNGLGFWDLKIVKKAGVKRCIARSSNASDGGSLKSRVAHFLGRRLFQKYVDVKIAPSTLAAEYTFGKKAVKNGEVALLNNGIDLSAYCYEETARREIRTEFEVADDEILFGHIGRFAEQKNHSFLLDVFYAIQQKEPKAKLLLVGKGLLEKEIKAKAQALGIAEKVIFAGQRTDVPKLLSAMDVFVFPSFYEGMPNTVIEAQATGLPCVIADTITREANVTGLVEYLPLNISAEEWAQKALLRTKDTREDRRELLRENGYDIHKVVQDFIRLVFGEDK